MNSQDSVLQLRNILYEKEGSIAFLTMACTIRLAADTAKFGRPEVKIGTMPGYGGSQRLPRLVGKGRALQIMLSGQIIGAQAAAPKTLTARV
jgi:enoyl-CoA hydratase/carnithine racemase